MPTLEKNCPKAVQRLRAAADGVLTYMVFPQDHGRRIHPTVALELQDNEIRRRTRVVGIFLHRATTLRLVTMLLWEQHGDGQAMSKTCSSMTSTAKVARSVSPPPDLMKESATG